MPILIALLGLIILALVFGPQIWVRHVLARHSVDRPDLDGTGGELARHLLDLADLKSVGLEVTEGGDHYDPADRVVRLSADHHNGRTVTALAVAAHEVGHALQHRDGDRLLRLRNRMAPSVLWLERIAFIVILLSPLAALRVGSLSLLFLQAGFAIGCLVPRVLLHLVTLPVELDASFRRALPILERGRFLETADLPAARSVLRAAAFTYVAAALATLLNIARLARTLRF